MAKQGDQDSGGRDSTNSGGAGSSGGLSLSLAPGELPARVAALFDPYQRNPELCNQLYREAQRRLEAVAQNWEGVSAQSLAEGDRLQSRKDDLDARMAELEQTHNWQVADLREKQGKELDQKRAKTDERLKELRQNVTNAQTALDEVKQARTVEVGGALADGASARDAAGVTAKAEREVASAQAALDKAKSALRADASADPFLKPVVVEKFSGTCEELHRLLKLQGVGDGSIACLVAYGPSLAGGEKGCGLPR